MLDPPNSLPFPLLPFFRPLVGMVSRASFATTASELRKGVIPRVISAICLPHSNRRPGVPPHYIILAIYIYCFDNQLVNLILLTFSSSNLIFVLLVINRKNNGPRLPKSVRAMSLVTFLIFAVRRPPLRPPLLISFRLSISLTVTGMIILLYGFLFAAFSPASGRRRPPADDAFARFCGALCPLDLRGRLAAPSSLRAELALPLRLGGLGIPIVAQEAPFRAADQWDYRDAREAGMLEGQAAAVYRRPPDALDWHHVSVGLDAHYAAVAASLGAGLDRAAARALARRRERNQLRSAMWAACAVPWVPELTIDHLEWDFLWRLAFGDLSAEARRRLDDPEEGHSWRGRRMEYAVAEAIREEVPPGVLAVWSQPAPERFPPDHVERCRRAKTSPEGCKRADIGFAFVTGKTITLDVRTVNVHCASASAAGSVAACLRAREREKVGKYADYYRDFKPFVIELGGAVSESSYGALKQITKEAAKAARPRLHWEKFDWAARVQRRIAVAMVRTAAWLATRAPVPVIAPGSRLAPGASGQPTTAG